MIQDFFKTVQRDCALLYNAMGNKAPVDKEQEKKVNLAAMRFFATVGMGIGIVVGLKALPLIATSVVGAALVMSMGVAIYALSHDVFVIAKNSSDQVGSNVKKTLGVAKSAFGTVCDLFKGTTTLKDALHRPRHPAAEGTILRPIWDEALARA